MKKQLTSRLTRPRYPMPGFVRKALNEYGLMAAYKSRPAYQQNDYIGWITRAKLEDTQNKRLDQMFDELFCGDRYMKMVYKPKRFKNSKEDGSSRRSARAQQNPTR
jgi:hypothetical protein